MRKPNICYMCGSSCYGKVCRACYRKDAKKPLAQYYNKKRRGKKNES